MKNYPLGLFNQRRGFVSIICEPYGIKNLSVFPTKLVVPELPILVKTKFGYRREWFLVDSGADITMLPYFASNLLECKLEKSRTKMFGIDGYGVCVYKSKIKVRFFNEEETIKCVFSERDDIPFILGRLDVLDKYNMLFYKNEVCLEKQ